MTYEQISSVFGWIVVINLGIYAFTAIAMLAARDWIAGIHGRMLGLERRDVLVLYAYFLTGYKLMLAVFFVGP